MRYSKPSGSDDCIDVEPLYAKVSSLYSWLSYSIPLSTTAHLKSQYRARRQCRLTGPTYTHSINYHTLIIPRTSLIIPQILLPIHQRWYGMDILGSGPVV